LVDKRTGDIAGIADKGETMRVCRKILITAALVFLWLGSTAFSAYFLPDSTYADLVGNWEGSSIYDENGMYVLVEYSVYNTQGSLTVAEQELIDSLGDIDGDFVYAYQIFNSNDAENEVALFQVLDIDEQAIPQSLMSDTSAVDDGNGGLSPILPCGLEGCWEFDGGVLVAGEHSYFLYFTSDSAPVAGTYEIESDTSDFPVVPEPGSVLLLGLGGLFFVRKNRKA
jgi:hypothetical protein